MADFLKILRPMDGGKSLRIDDLPEEAWTVISGQAKGNATEVYRAVPYLFRAVDIRMHAVASMPFSIYQGEDEIDSSASYENTLKFLPNPGQLFGQLEAAFCIWGAGYALRERDAKGERLRYLVPSTVQPQFDDVSGLVGFSRGLKGRNIDIPTEALLYFWKPDPFVELGPPTTSPLQAAAAAAQVLLNVDKFAAAFFERGATKSTLLTVKGNPIQQERERLKAWWRRVLSGIKNAWSSEVVSADGVTPVVIGEGLEGIKDTELTGEKREQIATALGIPYSVLFSNASTYATAKEDALHFYDKTIIPDCELIASVMNTQLLVPMGYRLSFLPETLDVYQESENDRAASLGALVGVLKEGPVAKIAMDILGYDLPDEILAALEELWGAQAKRDEAAALLAAQQAAQQAQSQTQPAQQPPQSPAPAEPHADDVMAGQSGQAGAMAEEMKLWRRVTLKRMKEGKTPGEVTFKAEHIPPSRAGAIEGALQAATTVADVHRIFNQAVWQNYL